LHLVFGGNHATGTLDAIPSRHQKLSSPLGSWLSSTTAEWEINKSLTRLYHVTDFGIKEFWIKPSTHNRRQVGVFGFSADVLQLPPETQPAEVYKRRDLVVCVGTAPRILFANPPSPTSFTEFINTEQFREHIGEVTITDDTTMVARALQNNQAIAVCDGSFKDGRGTASAVIQGTNSTDQIRTDTIVTGYESHQCSFRSEATGILSVILTVNAICRYHSITKGSIILGCDGESVLTKIRYHKEPINPDSLHFDIVSLIRRQIDASPIMWDFVFIKRTPINTALRSPHHSQHRNGSRVQSGMAAFQRYTEP
jgi:hypothetical protein